MTIPNGSRSIGYSSAATFTSFRPPVFAAAGASSVRTVAAGRLETQLGVGWRENPTLRRQAQRLFNASLQEAGLTCRKISEIIQHVLTRCDEADQQVVALTMEMGDLMALENSTELRVQEDIALKNQHLRSQIELTKAVKQGLYNTFEVTFTAVQQKGDFKQANFEQALTDLISSHLDTLEAVSRRVAIAQAREVADDERALLLQEQSLKASNQRVAQLLEVLRAKNAAQQRQEEFDLRAWMIKNQLPS